MMTKEKALVKQGHEVSRREERAHRILDAAKVLILRWGYHKVTVDDISRQAGVAKGTIYLHWKTREDLFAALMKREKLEIAEELKQRIANDPEGATLRGLLKHTALTLMERPFMKAVLLRDMEILGKLSQGEASKTAYLEKMMGFKVYLEFLREQGLVRTDLSLRAQVYIFSAIFMGFLLVIPLMPDDFTPTDEEIAELMAETAHCTLEPRHSVSPEALQNASHTFIQYMERSTKVVQEQFEKEIDA